MTPSLKPVACCPSCLAPVVATHHFKGAEWYCLDCGEPWPFLAAAACEPAPELVLRLKITEAEWATNATHLITPRARRVDCHKCSSMREEHALHASPLEVELHEQAVEWMINRRRAA